MSALPQLLTLDQVSKALVRSRSALYRDIDLNRIPPPRYLGGRPFWTVEEIRDVIDNLPPQKQKAKINA